MKKKSILTAALSLGLVGVIAVGSTLAYFSSTSDAVSNTFTTGNIAIEVVDVSDPTEGQVGGIENGEGGIDYGTETPIMPGDEISKIVGVEVLADSQDAWVALKLEVAANGSADDTAAVAAIWEMIDDAVAANNDWIEDDGIYYYQSILPAGDEADLFETLNVDLDSWGNDFAGMNFSISVQAAGVQAANVDTAADAQPMLHDLLNPPQV